MKKELLKLKDKIQKLKDRKTLINSKLDLLVTKKEELENKEIIAICRKNKITIEELLDLQNKKH